MVLLRWKTATQMLSRVSRVAADFLLEQEEEVVDKMKHVTTRLTDMAMEEEEEGASIIVKTGGVCC